MGAIATSIQNTKFNHKTLYLIIKFLLYAGIHALHLCMMYIIGIARKLFSN